MTNGQENSILTNFLHGDMNNPDAFFDYLSLNSQIQKTQATTYLANISQRFFIKLTKKKAIENTSKKWWSHPHSANPVYYYCSSTNLPHFVLVAFSLFDEAKTVAGTGFLGPKTLLKKK